MDSRDAQPPLLDPACLAGLKWLASSLNPIMRPFHCAITALAALMLSACVTMGELKPTEPPAPVRASERVPMTAVDVLVVSQPGFEAKKGLGIIPPLKAHTDRVSMLTDTVAALMRSLTADLKYTLGEAGMNGVVRFDGEGYRPSAQRTHLVTVVPVEAAQSTTWTRVTVRVTVHQVEGQRVLWQGTSEVSHGKSLPLLSDSVLAMLRSLGLQAHAKPPAPPIATGFPVKLGDSVAAVQAALGTNATPHKVESATREKSTALRLPERGLMVFFDGDNTVRTLRLEAPYSGEVRGIKLGSSRQAVLDTLGEPTRVFESLPMEHSLLYRTNAGTMRFDLDRAGKVKLIFVFTS